MTRDQIDALVEDWVAAHVRNTPLSQAGGQVPMALHAAIAGLRARLYAAHGHTAPTAEPAGDGSGEEG